jgi:hypothetical protein
VEELKYEIATNSAESALFRFKEKHLKYYLNLNHKYSSAFTSIIIFLISLVEQSTRQVCFTEMSGLFSSTFAM